jgi:hypothetical protein
VTEIVSFRQRSFVHEHDNGGASTVLSDARELVSDQQVEVDVCIIEAGPAEIPVAREPRGFGGTSRHWFPEREQTPPLPLLTVSSRGARTVPDASYGHRGSYWPPA